MASGWSQYAVMVRKCNEKIWGAGLFGHDGTMWGQDGLPIKTQEDVNRTKQEVMLMCQYITEGNKGIFENGFKFLNRSWAAVRIEEGMLVGKGKGDNTAQFAAKKTTRCFVVALAHAEGSNTNAISGASQIGEYLEESGY